MREIEFRGKWKSSGKWIYGSLVDKKSGERLISRYSEMLEFEGRYVHPETVGQYTGLKDKNGEKIFEGDVFEKTLHPHVYRRKKDKEGRFDVGETCDIHPGVLVRLKIVWDEKSCGFYCENVYVNPPGVKTGSTFLPRSEIAVGDLWPIEHFFNENRKMEIIGNTHDNPELLEGENGKEAAGCDCGGRCERNGRDPRCPLKMVEHPEPKLERCPFCGGEAVLTNYVGSNIPVVECKDCYAKSSSEGDSDEAIAAWNRRTESWREYEA